MTNDLSELVDVVSDDPEALSNIWHVVEWIASKPEGFAMLKEAYSLHRKPLKIVIDSMSINPVYGKNQEHAIFLNPDTINSHIFYTDNGEQIIGSMERVLSHELAHAAQPEALSVTIAQQVYEKAAQELLFTLIPWDQYSHRIKAGKNDDTVLKKVLEDIYDTHIEPNQHLLTNEVKTAANYSDEFREYVKNFEVPAIEFENLMMAYKGEPARSTDYINSGNYDNLPNAETTNLGRENFVSEALSMLQAARTKAQEKNGNTSSRIQ